MKSEESLYPESDMPSVKSGRALMLDAVLVAIVLDFLVMMSGKGTVSAAAAVAIA